jgi:hypothetical protein
MDTFVETAIVDYRPSFVDQGKQTFGKQYFCVLFVAFKRKSMISVGSVFPFYICCIVALKTDVDSIVNFLKYQSAKFSKSLQPSL